jgi:hypothetical protein
MFLTVDLYYSEARTFERYLGLGVFGVMPYVEVAYEVTNPLDAVVA